jgi:hypothetical protein
VAVAQQGSLPAATQVSSRGPPSRRELECGVAKAGRAHTLQWGRWRGPVHCCTRGQQLCSVLWAVWAGAERARRARRAAAPGCWGWGGAAAGAVELEGW